MLDLHDRSKTGLHGVAADAGRPIEVLDAPAPRHGDATLSDTVRVVLVIEDEHDRGLARAVLERLLPSAKFDEAADAVGLARIFTRPFDVAVVERGFAGAGDLQPALHEARPQAALILLAGDPTAEETRLALQAGWSDVVAKSSAGFLRLGRAVAEARARGDRRQGLERAEMRLQALLDRAGVGAFRATLDQRLIEASPAFLRLVGVETLQQAFELDLEPLFPPERDRGALLRAVDERGELVAREVELRRADGTPLRVRLTAALLLDPDGDMVVDGVIEALGSAADQETLADRLRQAERSNAELRDFAYVASHELQEPLRSVERFAALLAEETQGKLGAKGRDALAAVVEGTGRMQALVDDLLALARVETEGRPFEPCDLNALHDRAVKGLRRQIEASGAEITRDDLPVIEADSSQLQLVFHNLLANAIKFRRPEVPPRIQVGCERLGDKVRLAVRDNGLGLEPAQTESIFAMFARLHPDLPGTGMGLAICRRIVERHSGRLWAETASEGSVFRLELPVGERRRAARTDRRGNPSAADEQNDRRVPVRGA